jgi:DNA-binding transcriptional regulator LsrR (DeoR family)
VPRPSKRPKTADMIQAATLFYVNGKRKGDIATAMSTHTREVTWLLEEAKKRGIVKIQVQGTIATDLEDKIRMKYPHIQEVLIAVGNQVTAPEKHAELFRRWGVMAANYFEKLLEKQPPDQPIHVGVSGGEHLLEFVNAVQPVTRENVYAHVTALIGRGRLSVGSSHIDPVVTATILWSHCGYLPGHCEYATVSPYVSKAPGAEGRRAVREEIAKLEGNQTITDVIRRIDGIDVAFIGMGTVNPGRVNPITRNRVTMTSLLEKIVTPTQLEQEGAVGDLVYSCFDAQGNTQKKWEFFVTAGHGTRHAGVEFYKHMVATGRRVVCFAGPFMLDAIKVALNAKMFNVWITDEYTARQIAESD